MSGPVPLARLVSLPERRSRCFRGGLAVAGTVSSTVGSHGRDPVSFDGMRWRSCLGTLVSFLTTSCFDDGTGGTGGGCPVGSEGCTCTAGLSCDAGLVCRSDRCVSLDDETGTGGSTGWGTTAGSASTTSDGSATSDGPGTGSAGSDGSDGGLGTTGGRGTTGGDPTGDASGGGTTGPDSGGATGSTGGAPGEDPIYPRPADGMCPGDTAFLDPGTDFCGALCDASDVCPEAATGSADPVCAYNPDSSASSCTNNNQCPPGETCEDNAGGSRSCLRPASHCVLFCEVDAGMCPVQMICDPIGGGDGICVYP